MLLGALCTGQSQWCQGPRLDVITSWKMLHQDSKNGCSSVAALFDARNGNDFYTASAGEVLDEGPVNSEAEERAQKPGLLRLCQPRSPSRSDFK